MKTKWHTWLLIGGLLLAGSALMGCSRTEADGPTVTVYKSPTCGCCSQWEAHLQENGFNVETTETTDVMPIKEKFGVPGSLSSCHTAVVDGYALEGHVPADVIRQLLAERPEVAGIAVAGMPTGAPGMPGPHQQPYDVIAFTKDGRQYVYASR
jgi:hypothetical protein